MSVERVEQELRVAATKAQRDGITLIYGMGGVFDPQGKVCGLCVMATVTGPAYGYISRAATKLRLNDAEVWDIMCGWDATADYINTEWLHLGARLRKEFKPVRAAEVPGSEYAHGS